jgi:glycine cleavage system aminomethyltransferase T
MENNHNHGASGGVSIGAVIAAFLSWDVNHSIGLAILHALLNWLYVIYWLITYKM